MSKRQILMLVGLWNVFFLFLGFPSTWDKLFSIAMGLITLFIAYSLRPNKDKTKETKSYVEHRSEPQSATEPKQVSQSEKFEDMPEIKSQDNLNQ